MNIFDKPRNSIMEFNDVYFWTATIIQWRKLLTEDEFKNIIIDSMSYLSQTKRLLFMALS